MFVTFYVFPSCFSSFNLFGIGHSSDHEFFEERNNRVINNFNVAGGVVSSITHAT